MSLRDEFLAAVAHDLKNPLAAVKGYPQVLRRQAVRLEAPGAAKLANGFTLIDNTVTRAVTQLNELLDLAHLQAGQSLQLDRQPLDLVALVRRVAAEQQQISRHHAIRVEANLPQLRGEWDPARLERAFGNLLSNAIKYSPLGGEVVVTVAAEIAAAETWAVLTVRDHGIGISAADLPHIFEPFFRGGNAGGQATGTGLGLASVRHIIEQHQGTISVTSHERQGTTFTVRLPAGHDRRPQPAAP